MTERWASGEAVPVIGEADLAALFRLRADAPEAPRSGARSVLNRLRASDDPAVAFGSLARACVPDFADGCRVELSDGNEPPFRVTCPAGSAEPSDPAELLARSDHVMVTPFRVVSQTGYPSYAGMVTHWWSVRTPSESDAVIADMMVRYLSALVDRERLSAAVGRAEDRAASLALDAICGRSINLATGIVMHQHQLAADDAEKLLRRSARTAGTNLTKLAAGVVRSCALMDSEPVLIRVDHSARGATRRVARTALYDASAGR
jgi:hypothetical protein